MFKCEEWEVEDKQNKTINNFYNWYEQDDTIMNVIFQDKNKNIALSLKNGDENNMFLDFSETENFWIRDSKLIDTYKLETELSKHNLINKYFEADSSNIKVFDFSTNEEFKNISKNVSTDIWNSWNCNCFNTFAGIFYFPENLLGNEKAGALCKSGWNFQ